MLLFLFSNNLNASSESERLMKKKALDEIFMGLDEDKNKSKYELYVDEQTNLYAIKYITLVKSKLGDLSLYLGNSCSLEVTLSESGEITKVSPNEKSKFCDFVTTKFRKIKNLPVPKNPDVRKNLLKVHLLIHPTN